MKLLSVLVALGVLLVAPAARAEEQSAAPSREDEGLHVGAIAGVGFPDGARGDAVFRFGTLVSAGVGGGMLPRFTVPGMTNTQVSRLSGEGWVRLHPFRGAFYLGVAGGVARIDASASERETVAGQSADLGARATIQQGYVVPHLGAMWRLPFGITLGADVGVLVPIANDGGTVTATRDGMAVDKVPSGLTDAARLVARTPIPVLHVLELGVVL